MRKNRTSRYFDDDFKLRAVQMVLDGRGVNEVATDLGIAGSTVQRWKQNQLKQMDSSVAPGSRSASELAQDNDRLRRELAYVSEQRDILKKTIRIFGEENGRARR